LYEWIVNYLTNRQQVTSVNGQISECNEVDTGSSQGSLLGPRLFSIAANNLPDLSNEHKEDLFADDTTGSCADSTIDGLMVKTQKMVDDISKWSHQNCITIHPKKSVIMLTSSKSFIGPLPQITLDGKPIAIVSKAKCLARCHY